MNRRGFCGTFLSGLSGFFFPQKAKSLSNTDSGSDCFLTSKEVYEEIVKWQGIHHDSNFRIIILGVTGTRLEASRCDRFTDFEYSNYYEEWAFCFDPGCGSCAENFIDILSLCDHTSVQICYCNMGNARWKKMSTCKGYMYRLYPVEIKNE